MAIDYDLLNMILNGDQLANDDPSQIINRIDPRTMYLGDSQYSSSPYTARRSAFDEMRPEQQGQYLLNQTRQLGNVSNAPIPRTDANVPFDVGTLDLQNQAPINTQQANVSNNVNNQPFQPIQIDNRPDLQPSLITKLFDPKLAAKFPNQPIAPQSQQNTSGQNMAQNNSSSFMQNIFGVVPNYYEGLLGPAETQAIQKRSTQQGLLGAAISLLGGMGTRGTTAQQNIAGALSGGIQASQGAIQQGLTNYQMQQQLAQAKIAQEQAASLRADVARVMQMPEVANNPALIASLRADPAKTLAWINENMAISKAYEPAPQQTGAVTSMAEQPQTGTAVGGEKSLPGVTVTAPRSKIETEINRLLTANQRLTVLPGKTAQDAIKSNLDQITGLQKQLMREDVSNFDFNGIKGAVSPDLLSQVNNLQRLAETGQISAKDLQDGLRDIQKADFEFKNSQRDYTKEAVRVAGSMFPTVAFNALNAEQLGQLQNKLDTLDIVKRKAGAININMPSESERTAGYLTTRFKNSLQQYNEVLGKNPEAAVPSLQAEIIRSVTNSNYLTNLATPEARQRMIAAELDMLSAALTLSTGAAYTPLELETQRQSLFPQLGDKPANIRDKAVRLNKLLKEAAMVKAGRAAPSSTTEADEVLLELERRKGK
jgi:hypothetical protein